jgi:peroxiredoxin-like protein
MTPVHYYEVAVQWENERKGKLSSPVLHSEIEVVTPPEFPKGIAGSWSPEHLLVAAVNGCLMTTFLAIAENSKLEYRDFYSKAIGKLEVIEGKYLISEIELIPVVTIEDEQQQDRAIRILQKAEANCLISNSIKSTIIFKPSVKILNTSLAL